MDRLSALSLRAITLWQPWATLVALGIKKIETRHWKTDFRGPLLIHAAKNPRLTEAEERKYSWLLETNGHKGGLIRDLPYGSIVAVCTMTDCLKMVNLQHFTQGSGEICISHQSYLEKALGDWRAGRYAWELDGVVKVAPIPVKGMQGFWSVPENVIEQVRLEIQKV